MVMRWRARSLAIALVLLASALTAPSCVSVIGADGVWEPVIGELCPCLKADPNLNFEFKDSCESVIEGRLRRAAPDTRAAWMENYDKACRGCTDEIIACYRMEPTCSSAACATDNECCEGKVCKDINGEKLCTDP
jgi:hypothetical protein